jgi:dipeptidyl aminopeptidase/acylaminoacyl peptidase
MGTFRDLEMFKKRVLRVAAYAILVYLLGAIALAEISLHPIRVRHGNRLSRVTTLAEQSAKTSGGRLEDVSIQAQDGTRLQAWFVQPAASNGSVVMLLHGVGDSRAGMAAYMSMFLQHGYSLLMPDSRGHGASGGVATYGLYEAGDVHAWVDWLEANRKPSCVFALGESMGAGILLESLGVEHRFCAVTAESGYADFREAAYDRVSGEFSTGPWLAKTVLRPVVEGAFLEGRFVHGLKLESVRPQVAVAASATPILLIHGAADTHLRLRHSQLLHQANPKSELWVVPGVEHTLVFRTYPREFADRVLNFFAAHAASGRGV